ncbi:MAG: alpha/beta hydrolase [Saprospiraceae bacterium]
MNKIKHVLCALLLCCCLPACEKFELEKKADTYFHIQSENAVLPVWVRGNTSSKKFIIFVNGGPGLTSIDVALIDLLKWKDGLEKDFALVYYDQRGCGNVQSNLSKEDISVGHYVRDLDAIIEVLKSKYSNPEIILMGHSFGSYISMEYLQNADFQDKITAWISIDGAFNFDQELSWQFRRAFLDTIANEELAKGKEIQHWQNALDWLDQNPVISTREQKKQWQDFIGRPGGIILPADELEITGRELLKIGFDSPYNVFPAYFSTNLEIVNEVLNDEVEGKNFIAYAENIEIPSLFIWGKYDDLIVPQEGKTAFEKLASKPEDKEFILFENSGHEPFLSEPIFFEATVANFLKK